MIIMVEEEESEMSCNYFAKMLLLPGSCCCSSNEPSDKRVYLIHILINMEPHFLRFRALGEDTIHQALS